MLHHKCQHTFSLDPPIIRPLTRIHIYIFIYLFIYLFIYYLFIHSYIYIYIYVYNVCIFNFVSVLGSISGSPIVSFVLVCLSEQCLFPCFSVLFFFSVLYIRIYIYHYLIIIIIIYRMRFNFRGVYISWIFADGHVLPLHKNPI